MKIKLRQPHQSIRTLTTEDLPDFAVLFGRNGAGKTQLLHALRQGAAVIPGVSLEDIELHDMVSFGPPNAGPAGRQAGQFAQFTAEAAARSRARRVVEGEKTTEHPNVQIRTEP